MKHTLTIFLALLATIHFGCGQASVDTTTLIWTSESAPYETITMRLKTKPNQAGSRQFGLGQPIGTQGARVTPVIRYSNGTRYVDVVIRKEGVEDTYTFSVVTGAQSSHELPYGISVVVK